MIFLWIYLGGVILSTVLYAPLVWREKVGAGAAFLEIAMWPMSIVLQLLALFIRGIDP